MVGLMASMVSESAEDVFRRFAQGHGGDVTESWLQDQPIFLEYKRRADRWISDVRLRVPNKMVSAESTSRS
jgi:hypothetical protein